MPLMKTKGKVKEGEILNKWIYNKMIKRNQNILLAITGPTGSGKSYMTMAIVDSWYRYYFKHPYPVSTHVCFSIDELMKLLSSKKLKRGEILVLEEAGVNMGSLDFQNKVSKIFTYVLQSFRSMNVGVIFNLPVLTMMNKSARYLIHAHFITAGINYQTKQSKVKPYFRQVNQQSGKIYQKFLRVMSGNKSVTVKRFAYSIPADPLVNAYETKKLKFVSDLNADFVKELQEIDKENIRKMSRNDLTDTQQEVYNYILDGYTPLQIAEIRGCKVRSIYTILESATKKGYEWKKIVKSLEKATNVMQKPIPVPL